MKSSDGKDWWEYVDPTVTKELLDELTKEFLRIFDACPSRLKRRISNEKITSQSRKRPKESFSESHSASTAKSVPSSSASVSSVDSGLPGSGNSESSVNTQELIATTSSQGDSLSLSQDNSHTEGDKLGLHEINMGLPMMEASMFPLESEYMSGVSFNPGAEIKHGPPSTQSDADQGKPMDQQGHPVKKSLKEYREQKERERMKNAQSREKAPPRPSHTASRPGAVSNQNLHTPKVNVDASHTDQRHREGYHSQGGQKHRPEDRHLPVEHRRAEKASGVRQEQSGSHPQSKSSGRPTDLRPTRDQRPLSQHRPHDSGSQPSQASVTDSRYSKSLDQYHKHSRDSVPHSSDRKQHLGPGEQGKEHKRNGFENREHSANLRLPEAHQRLLSSAPPTKPHATASQRPHTETLNAHSSEKMPTSELHGKPHPETLRPSKSEMYRSHRPEHQGNLKSEKHRTPSSETVKLQKSQSLKPHRSEIPKGTSTEKERTQPAIPPLVPAVDTKREQRSAPTVETQRVEPPQPIYQELPRPQRPERVLLQQPQTLKVDRRVTQTPNKHDSLKVRKTEDQVLHRSDTVILSKTEVPSTKSAGVSKEKDPEATKSLKSDVLSKPHKTEESRLPRAETHNTQRVEIPKPQTTDMARRKEPEVPQTQKPQQLKVVKAEPQQPGNPTVQTRTEKLDVSKTQKVVQSQPHRPETPKKQRVKQEQGQPQKAPPPKSQPPQAIPGKLLEKDSGITTTKLLTNKSQKLQTPVVQKTSIKSEVPDVSVPSKLATRKKPLTPPTSKQEAPTPEKPVTVSSQKLVANKSKQPEMSTSGNPDKAPSQRSETVILQKTDTQSKPPTPKPQRSTTPRSRVSPGAAAEQVPKPSRKVETPKLPKADTGGASVSKVVWEPAKPLEVLKPAVSDEVADSESVDADIDKLINAHMAEQSIKQGLEVPPILDLKPTLPLPNTTESREQKRERDESNLPKSYREKESHHRKKRSEGHKSRGSPHKHRHSSDHRKGSRVDAEGQPSSAEKQANASEGIDDSQPHSSILTTSSGIRLKIKGLSNSMNSGSGKHEPSPEPSRQTSSPGLVMKLNLSKMQASHTNSDHQPESSAGSEKSSGHHRRHRHHHRHKHGHHKHHRSESHHHGDDGRESHKRKRSHSRSDSVSSGGRDASPAMSSPAKKRTHSRASHSHPKSILPSEQSLLNLPMPPADPSSAYTGYDTHSSASTGQFSYGMRDFSHHAPLTTVTALPSSDGFEYYPYNQSSDGHAPPPPPPPREDLPPPPPPPM
ncbi:cyclin-T-like isoform X2 [Patiria miniata]|nr:cyclin-T-like isoform X2 [Patiria miniata]